MPSLPQSLRRFCLAAALLLGTGLALRPAAAQPPEPFFFVHVADPQLPWGPQAAWEKTVAAINRLHPAFVVVGGDLINADGDLKKRQPEPTEALAKSYLDVAATLAKDIPLYHVAGNHDVGNVPSPESLAWFRQRFGEPWYSFGHRQAAGIVLESNVLRNSQGAPALAAAELAWLKETLAKPEIARAPVKIVFLHHPLCLKSIDEKEAYENLPLPLRRQLLELFHAHGVRLVLSGHYHRNAQVRDGDLDLVTTASCGKALGQDPTGLRLVKVYADHVEHEYLPLDRLPEKVQFTPPAPAQP